MSVTNCSNPRSPIPDSRRAGATDASVPGSSFFHNPQDGRRLVRFAFCKRLETLEAAAVQLKRLLERHPEAT
jgi:hypothetical protein